MVAQISPLAAVRAPNAAEPSSDAGATGDAVEPGPQSPHPSASSDAAWVHESWTPPPPKSAIGARWATAKRLAREMREEERGAVTAEYAIVIIRRLPTATGF